MHRKPVNPTASVPTPLSSAFGALALHSGIPASESLLQHVHIVMPPHANHMGNMFGGIYME